MNFPSARMQVERRVDGTLVVTPELPLAAYSANLPSDLADLAAKQPQKPCLAERRHGPTGPWSLASYAEVNAGARAIAAWLLAQRIERGRSVLILSGNSIAHAMMKLGAMAARVPACPVSVNYSLMRGDFGRLRHVIALVRPAVVFAESAQRFKTALEQVEFGDAILVTDEPAVLARKSRVTRLAAIDELLATTPGPAVDESIAAIEPDEPTLYMLTSGSTSMPKAVVQTQRMLCSNIAQIRQVLGAIAGFDEVMLDWLPWSHVSGAANQLVTLASGGTFYIDGGRPIPGAFEESLRNLGEITPPYYGTVPLAYTMLVDAMERDAVFRQRFLGSLRLGLYGGAGLSQAIYDRFQQLAIDTVGRRIFLTTGYGATETTAGCMSIYFDSEQVGIGLPMPGLALKLVPVAGRYEVRLKGPMVTPGYLGDEKTSADAFDAEGFYRTGDTAEMHDEADICKGLKFAGRLAEEFKLSNGTWVTAGRLRAVLLEAFSPLLADLLVCGENRDRLGVLAWPKRPDTAELRQELFRRLTQFNAGRGASERISALGLLQEPPVADAHEVSDKGSINQRVAIARRAQDVAMLYSDPPDPRVILPGGNEWEVCHAS